MQITMVKKVYPDGTPCRKCEEAVALLKERGYYEKITREVIADERDPDGEGMRLVKEHNIKVAPFFIVEKDDGTQKIYKSVLKIIKEVFAPKRMPR